MADPNVEEVAEDAPITPSVRAESSDKQKVDYSEGISILSVHPIRPLIHCLSENVVLATRGTWSVFHSKIQWQWPA